MDAAIVKQIVDSVTAGRCTENSRSHWSSVPSLTGNERPIANRAQAVQRHRHRCLFAGVRARALLTPSAASGAKVRPCC